MKFTVEKSIEVTAKHEVVIENIQNLTNWSQWSPWLCLDNQTMTSVEGNSLTWSSKLIGKGAIHFVSESTDKLQFNLVFFSPFKSKAKVTFTIVTQGNQQRVTWHMIGNLPLIMLFHKKFMSIMIGLDYQRGLIRLKNLSELGYIPAKLEFEDTPFNVDSFKCMGLAAKGSFADVATHMKQTFTKLYNTVEQEKLQISKVYCFCEKVMFVKDIIQYSAAVEVEDIAATTSTLAKSTIPAHKAIKVTLSGDYKFLADALSGLHVQTRGLKLPINKQIPPDEVYVQGPHNCENPEDYITEIYMPVL